MTRRELFRCTLYTAVIPILVLGNSIRSIYSLIKREHISDREILINLLEPVSDELTSVALDDKNKTLAGTTKKIGEIGRAHV